MHRVVHCDEVERLWGLVRVRVPAVKQDGHVVVPVEENEGSPAGNDEERVDELRNLREDEQLDPKSSGPISPAELAMLRAEGRESSQLGRSEKNRRTRVKSRSYLAEGVDEAFWLRRGVVNVEQKLRHRAQCSAERKDAQEQVPCEVG